MPKMQEFMHAPVKQLDAAIAIGLLTEDQVRAILVVRAQRQSVPGRHARAWLARHAQGTTVAPVLTLVTTAPAAPKAPKATGIGAKGGDVRWGIASALTKGQGYDARRAEHERLVKLTPEQVRAYAQSHGLTIAANAKVA